MALAESVEHRLSSGAVQNPLERLVYQTTEGNRSLFIQTAWNHRAVHQDAEVRAQTVTTTPLPQHRQRKIGPNELGVKMQIQTAHKTVAFFLEHVDGGRHGNSETFAHATEYVQICRALTANLPQIPKSVIQVEFGPFFERALRVREYFFQILRRVAIGKIVGKTVQRKIHLPERRVQQKSDLLFTQQHPVGHQEKPRPRRMRDFDELLKARVHQRIAHQMKRDLFRDRRDLPDGRAKQLQVHQLMFAHDRGTKTAFQIADVTDLDMNFRVALHSGDCSTCRQPRRKELAGQGGDREDRAPRQEAVQERAL